MRTPQEIRQIRLKNDHKEMVNIKGNIVSWKPVKGTPPFVEEYELNRKPENNNRTRPEVS